MSGRSRLALWFCAIVVVVGQVHADVVERRVEAALAQLTLTEKIELLGGTGFASKAIPRLGIPELAMTDGPVGVRWEKATAFPVGIAMAASFNPQLIGLVGQGLARDAKAYGRYMLLGPCVNLSRTPFGGRNFESFGEDPYLTSSISETYIRGVQSQGVAATVKHFGLNEQEYERFTINVVADERTMRELHFPAFHAAVKAGVWSVMSSYNRLNGPFAGENQWLLQTVLKQEWGFPGLVVSDWGATHNALPAALNGLDLEMPFGEHMNLFHLMPAIQSGLLDVSVVDDKVRRLLRVLYATGMVDHGNVPVGEPDSASNRELALRVAQESLVLLKNRDNILPLNLQTIKRIAVLGPNAAVAQIGGGGSSTVAPNYQISPLEGLRERVGDRAFVEFVDSEKDLEGARSAARAADVVLLFVGLNSSIESEGFDRVTLDFPEPQQQLIRDIQSVNENVVLVINSGAPVLLRDLGDRAKAIVASWYPGQEGGRAVADVLLGNVNPSGKLPITWIKRWEDHSAFGHYPGVGGQVSYSEGIFLGYRHAERFGRVPEFPFGHGLSYTRFTLESAQLVGPTVREIGEPVQLRVRLTNIGSRAGAETVQVYVQDKVSSVARPVKELKAFRKIFLQPGESRTVTLELDPSAFSFFHPVTRTWITEPGEFALHVGMSSADIREVINISISGTRFPLQKRRAAID